MSAITIKTVRMYIFYNTWLIKITETDELPTAVIR